MKSWIIGVSASNYLWWSTPEEQNVFYFLDHLEIEKINFLWKGLFWISQCCVILQSCCFTVIEFHIPFLHLCLPFPPGRELVKNNQSATVMKIRKNGSRRTELSVIFHISCAGIETNVTISIGRDQYRWTSLRTFTQGHLKISTEVMQTVVTVVDPGWIIPEY